MATQDDYTRITLRIPKDLHARLAKAAEETSKSMNAEIIARLELAFLGEPGAGDLIPAAKARELSEVARQGIPAIVRDRILVAIKRAVSMGHDNASVDFGDLELEALPEMDLESLITSISGDLEAAGYRAEWDGGESVWIKF